MSVRHHREQSALRAIIIAFDGLVIESIAVRADALHAELEAHGYVVTRSDVAARLPGRTVAETIRRIVPAIDESLLDRVVIRTQQIVSARMSHGIALAPTARHVIEREYARGTRIVLRCDSLRRDVEGLLTLSGLEQSCAFVRCADDTPRAPGIAMLAGAYHAILRRLESTTSPANIQSLEFSEDAATAAGLFVEDARFVSALS